MIPQENIEFCFYNEANKFQNEKFGIFTYIAPGKSASYEGNLISKPGNCQRRARFCLVVLEKVLEVP